MCDAQQKILLPLLDESQSTVMRARDIMTISVVTTRPGTPVRELANLLSKRQFSGLPVVDEEREASWDC